MDLWSAQVGGPCMIAGVEYRVSPDGIDEVFFFETTHEEDGRERACMLLDTKTISCNSTMTSRERELTQ
jgi:hypothetical protein